MKTLQYTIDDEHDLASFQLSFISLMEELVQCKDIAIYCWCKNDTSLKACQAVISDKFNKTSSFALSCGVDQQHDAIHVTSTSLFLFGSLRKFADGEDCIQVCTETDSNSFMECVEGMQTHCKIPPVVFVFRGKEEDKVTTIGVMKKCLHLVLSLYNHIDTIMESITTKMQEESKTV